MFNGPTNTALDSLGNLYVVDSENHRIQKFDPKGKFILKWGTNGIEDGELDCPSDIAIDSKDLVFVADPCKQQIQLFDTKGKFLSKWGKSGTGNGYLYSPSAIILDTQHVYVVDYLRSSIQKFTKNGEFISLWKTERDEVCPKEGLNSKGPPCKLGIDDIAMDSDGNFLVVKRLDNSLEKISPQGVSLAKWKLEDNENNKSLYPVGITIDSSDNIYVTTEGGRSFLYQFAGDGTIISKWLRKDVTNPFYVRGVSVDKSDNFYVSFLGINVVEKFTNQGKLINTLGKSDFDNTGFSVYPPLQQIKMGVPWDLVACRDNLSLVINFRDEPSCVSPESIPNLVNRGWIRNTSINEGTPLECYLEPNPGVCNNKMTKYYFDLESNSCQPFTWNGCRGTVPFDTFGDCQSLCLR